MLKLLFTILCLTHFLFFFTTATTTQQPLGTSTLVDVTAHACLPRIGLFKTLSQVDLGTPNTVANQFLKANFARCFGTGGGLKLGADVELDLENLLNLNLNLNLLGQPEAPLQLVFDSAQAVTDFLPQLNPAGILNSVTDLTDPTTCPAGSLAGELLALNLNAVFDQVFPSFGAADLNLTALVLVKGPCAGLSVGAVIDLASEVLSGVVPEVLAKVKLFNPATIGSCVAAINANFLNGAHVGTYVALPGFNAQANLNVKLPLNLNLNLDAAVKATLSLQTGLNTAAYLHVVLAGLQADAALSLKNTVYNAWNLDLAANLNLKANLDVALALNSCLLSSLPSSITGVVDATVDVDLFALVNYVLNFHARIHASVDVQAAILCLLNPSLSVKACVNSSGLVGVNLKVVAAIVADARLNGIGFIPAPNQLVGVVAKVKLGSGLFTRVLLEVKVPALDLNINSKLCIGL